MFTLLLSDKLWFVMEVENLTDSEGNKIQFRHYNGHVFHVDLNKDIRQKIEDQFKNFKCREDDVIICSYPKTGMYKIL